MNTQQDMVLELSDLKDLVVTVHSKQGCLEGTLTQQPGVGNYTVTTPQVSYNTGDPVGTWAFTFNQVAQINGPFIRLHDQPPPTPGTDFHTANPSDTQSQLSLMQHQVATMLSDPEQSLGLELTMTALRIAVHEMPRINQLAPEWYQDAVANEEWDEAQLVQTAHQAVNMVAGDGGQQLQERVLTALSNKQVEIYTDLPQHDGAQLFFVHEYYHYFAIVARVIDSGHIIIYTTYSKCIMDDWSQSDTHNLHNQLDSAMAEVVNT